MSDVTHSNRYIITHFLSSIKKCFLLMIFLHITGHVCIGILQNICKGIKHILVFLDIVIKQWYLLAEHLNLKLLLMEINQNLNWIWIKYLCKLHATLLPGIYFSQETEGDTQVFCFFLFFFSSFSFSLFFSWEFIF